MNDIPKDLNNIDNTKTLENGKVFHDYIKQNFYNIMKISPEDVIKQYSIK